MNLLTCTLIEYLKTLGSEEPAPGGGSASALCGAQGAGLCAMVAALTLGRSRYAQYQDTCAALLPQARALQKQLADQIDLDAQSYGQVAAAFSLPRQTPQEQAARQAAIEDATAEAARVPMHTLELAVQALSLAETLSHGFNRNAASDLAVAVWNLRTCAQGAWHNVKINVESLKNRELAEVLETQGLGLLQNAEDLAAAVLAQL